jgi:hypothetical protein
MDSPVRRMLDTKYTRIQLASNILGLLARIKTSKSRIDYKPVARLSGVRVNIASLPCTEYAHCHPNVGPLTDGSHIIGGNASTPPFTATWPWRCPTCWGNANLSGVSYEIKCEIKTRKTSPSNRCQYRFDYVPRTTVTHMF